MNFLCLPKQPEWLPRIPDGTAFLYGGEYDSTAFGFQNGDDMLCSVCHTTDNSVVMIPAHVSCNNGWTKQYRGYLGAGHHVSKAGSEYICVEENPEAFPRGRANENGKLVHIVQTTCGSLPCPPYENGRSVACVVCSK